jgi:long-subunit acyl-CoA synthetase (AMP-forming)
MQTTIELFFATAASRGDRVAFRHRVDGAWRETTWADNAQAVRRVGRALIGLGVPQGGNVAIVGPNRPEWLLAALGAQAAGGAPVGIYTTSTPAQTAYIVGHSEARVAVVHDRAQLAKLRAQKASVPALQTIVLMSGAADGPDVLSWADFLAAAERTPDSEVDARMRNIASDDVATLIYTSGTTGTPKAVMLTHANLLNAMDLLAKYLHLGDEDEVFLSYLPLSHIAEQLLSVWATCKLGSTIAFCEELEQLGDHLREVRPTLFFGVPRVWEKIQAKMVEAGAHTPWLKKKIAAWARGVGLRANLARAAGNPVPGGYGLARKLVFSKVRERLGLDRCRLMVSGAAAISRATLEFFLSLDIPIFEVYGMSESTAVMTIDAPGVFRFGSVGRCVPGYELKLAEDGEILGRGPHVFKGYFKNPEATAETLDAEGWLHSGDIGELDKDGFLRIIDRKKDLFKTTGASYIAPQYLEGLLKGIPGVGQAAVVGGDDRKYVAALLVLDPESAPKVAASIGVSGTLAQIAEHPAFVAHVQRELDKVNAGLPRFESIKRVKLLADEFSIDSGEVTPTMKLRRKGIAAKYAREIEALFAESRPAAASATP